jgi:GTP-binding protein Era
MGNGPHRSGYAAIVGRPNVGKSTLLNGILGQKLSIVSPKPQTTRNRVLGILTRPDAQVLLLDTPGFHEGEGLLNRRMLEQAQSALSDVDVVLLLVDAQRDRNPGAQEAVLERVRRCGRPLILVPNKIDRVEKNALLPLIDAWQKALSWRSIVPISALRNDGLDRLVEEIVALLPEGPPWFPAEQVTDLGERAIVGELIREQIFVLLRDELPYAAAVEMEEWEEKPERALIRIRARIWVARESQKGIVIGRGGAMLKRIGTQARSQIERLLGTHVFLALTVGVDPDWTRRADRVDDLGGFRRRGES